MPSSVEGKTIFDSPWFLVPEIIAVAVSAIFIPLRVIDMFSIRHSVWPLLGLLPWAACVGGTWLCLKRRAYGAALLPMFLLLGLAILYAPSK